MTRTHGMSRTPLYVLWTAIIQRCTNPNHPRYADYGGRGIAICDAWRHDFAAFHAHVGDRPKGLTLDRIENDGPYAPGNVRWATYAEQRANRRESEHPESRKTHCPNNHPYDDANTYRAPGTGWRQCKTCQADNQRARRAQKETTHD